MRSRSISSLALGMLLVALGAPAQAQDSLRLTGSGATFPFPLYSTWFKAYGAKSKGVTVDYQGKGSGAGIQDFINRTVDFAASDAAMTDEQMAKVPGGVQLLPMTGGEIVIGYNLPGNPKGLKLPRDVYPAIFLGRITKWSDPKIKAANPGVALPDLDITVVTKGRLERDDVRVHDAPRRDQRGVEQRARRRDDGDLAQERQVRGLAQE